MSSRERYVIGGITLDDVVANLNFMLQHIGDRLDKIEGIRGTTDFVGSGLEIDGDVELTGDVTINGSPYSTAVSSDDSTSFFLGE